MLKLLRNTFLILAPVFLSLLLFEYGLGKVTNSYSFKKTSLEKALGTVQVLNVGSSHEVYSINPACFSFKGYNLANVSQSLYYDASLINLYAEKMPALKLLFIPVSYFSLGSQLSEGKEEWRGYFYTRYFDIPLDNDSKAFDVRNFSLFALYGNSSSLDYLKKGFNVDLAQEFQENGFYSKKLAPAKKLRNIITDEKGAERAQLHSAGINPKNYSNNYANIEKMVLQCRNRGIVPVLISSPTFQTYYRHIDTTLWNQTKSRLRTLQDTYALQWFDYSNDPRFTFDDFRDNDHMSPRGAEKFSTIINAEILIPRLLNK